MRICYFCKKSIGFLDFKQHNCRNFTYEELEKIWNSPYVQLYCCFCYNLVQRHHNRRLQRKKKFLNSIKIDMNGQRLIVEWL